MDAAGCTRSEGHYKNSDGKIKCGPDCPRGWKLVAGDYCQEDLNESCSRCQEAIQVLQSWKIPAPVGEQKQIKRKLRECSQGEGEAVFEEFKAEVIGSLQKAQRACEIQKRTPRVMPRVEMAFADWVLTPCVQEIRSMDPWTKLTGKSHFMFDCAISDQLITLPDFLRDF